MLSIRERNAATVLSGYALIQSAGERLLRLNVMTRQERSPFLRSSASVLHSPSDRISRSSFWHDSLNVVADIMRSLPTRVSALSQS